MYTEKQFKLPCWHYMQSSVTIGIHQNWQPNQTTFAVYKLLLECGFELYRVRKLFNNFEKQHSRLKFVNFLNPNTLPYFFHTLLWWVMDVAIYILLRVSFITTDGFGASAWKYACIRNSTDIPIQLYNNFSYIVYIISQ